MLNWINSKIIALIKKQASKHHNVDIVEVRTKEIGLLSVKTETIIKLTNSFFLPIEILNINTELRNGEGLVVGRMVYNTPQKISKKSSVTLIANSEISSISSIFHAISNILSQPIFMHSVGTATIKFLWWEVTIDVDDTFDILPHQLKIGKQETEEEKIIRQQKEQERKEIRELEKTQREAQQRILRQKRKEKILKARHGDNYIPKEERRLKKEESEVVEDEIIIEDVNLEITNIEEALENTSNSSNDIPIN